jgi:hypothetical protein
MSCHSPAEWQPESHKMLTFLLPSYPNPNPGPPFKPCLDGSICSPAPASADWFRWFQNRLGNEPFDPNTGSVATDFDMVFAYKTLPMWWKATGPASQLPLELVYSVLESRRRSMNTREHHLRLLARSKVSPGTVHFGRFLSRFRRQTCRSCRHFEIINRRRS